LEARGLLTSTALVDYTLVPRPERIILGGGVIKQKQIFQLVREQFMQLLMDYVQVPDLETYFSLLDSMMRPVLSAAFYLPRKN
jgi:fructokinase